MMIRLHDDIFLFKRRTIVSGIIYTINCPHLQDGKFGVGSESLECGLFYPDEIDMENLAFETVKQTIERYLDDKAQLDKLASSRHCSGYQFPSLPSYHARYVLVTDPFPPPPPLFCQ